MTIDNLKELSTITQIACEELDEIYESPFSEIKDPDARNKAMLEFKRDYFRNLPKLLMRSVPLITIRNGESQTEYCGVDLLEALDPNNPNHLKDLPDSTNKNLELTYKPTGELSITNPDTNQIVKVRCNSSDINWLDIFRTCISSYDGFYSQRFEEASKLLGKNGAIHISIKDGIATYSASNLVITSGSATRTKTITATTDFGELIDKIFEQQTKKLEKLSEEELSKNIVTLDEQEYYSLLHD